MIIMNNDINKVVNDIKKEYNFLDIDDNIIDDLLNNNFSDESNNFLKLYFQEINKPLLSIEEEKKLAKLVSEGNMEARNIFIERNLKLVVNIAKRYIFCGLSFLDLIQEGNMALIKAVDTYDLSKNVRFSTYATLIIRQEILRAIREKSRSIKIPLYIHTKFYKYRKEKELLANKLGREPTIYEIANQMGICINDATDIHNWQLRIDSLDFYIDNEKDNELEKYISLMSEGLEPKVVDNIFKEDVRNIFTECGLDEREIYIIMLRHGFLSDSEKTLKEIGNILNLTHQRVEQIYEASINKIRRSKYMRLFVKNMDNYKELLSQMDNLYLKSLDDNEKKKKKKIKTI